MGILHCRPRPSLPLGSQDHNELTQGVTLLFLPVSVSGKQLSPAFTLFLLLSVAAPYISCPCEHACKVTSVSPTLCNAMDCGPLCSSVLGSPGKNTGRCCQALPPGIFLTQGLNPPFVQLLHCRWIIYH